MATDTYLEMVSDMIMETGLNANNVPSTIASATGDAAKVAYWIRVADLQIQRERIDWDFLWQKDTVNLSQSSAVIPSPINQPNATDINTATALINHPIKDGLAVIDANGEAVFPTFMRWHQFSILYDYEVQDESDFPSHWSMTPSRELRLSNPIASGGMTCKYEYYRKPLRLREDTDTTRIPDDFNRLVIVTAKIMYAEHEDAPEVEAGATIERDTLFNQMLSVHAPQAEWQRMENNDELLVVMPE
jgi:hypothetical protein